MSNTNNPTEDINRAAAVSIIKNHLNESDISITTETADGMNFTSVSCFRRYCVRHHGMSPGESQVREL